jgi:hypothetical protein
VGLVAVGAACRRSSPPPPAEEDAGLTGAIDPACAAPEMDLGAVVLDQRCAVTSARAKDLLADLQRDGGAARLVQDAHVADGGRVVLRLVNTGHAPVTLPLSWAPRVPAVSALADDAAGHALYELEPPALEMPGGPDAGVRFARIVLAPGAFATARFVPSATIAKRIAPRCEPSDGGTCAPPRLPPGRYGLHVGQLVVDVETGAPARVEWQVP